MEDLQLKAEHGKAASVMYLQKEVPSIASIEYIEKKGGIKWPENLFEWLDDLKVGRV